MRAAARKQLDRPPRRIDADASADGVLSAQSRPDVLRLADVASNFMQPRVFERHFAGVAQQRRHLVPPLQRLLHDFKTNAPRGANHDNLHARNPFSSGRAANHNNVPRSATGVHNTCSMRVAPAASITRRSKPSAMPLAGGMTASASRKSSSIGQASP